MKTCQRTYRMIGRQLLVVVATVFLAGHSYAASEDDFDFSGVTILGYTGPGGDLIIPATINGSDVRRIGRYAFEGNTNITSVTLPETVDEVRSFAFVDCTSLTNFVISTSVQVIDDGAISGCVNLESITVLPDNPYLTAVDGVLFNAAQTELKQFPAGKTDDYTIDSLVTTIRPSAFRGAEWPENIHIGENVSSIGASAFSGCKRLMNLSVASNNVHFADIDGVLFNQGLTQLRAFPSGRSGTYEVPNSVQTIVSFAFSGAAQLTSVHLPHGLVNIGSHAFLNCLLLEAIEIPETVTQIGSYAFAGCTHLQQVVIHGTNTVIEGFAFQNATALESVTLAEGVHTIGVWAFANCQSLQSIHIPASATSLGTRLFPGCISLTNITVAAANPNFSARDGVLFNKQQTQLREFATGLTGAYRIPAGVQSVASYAFSRSPGLSQVFLPESVNLLSREAFNNCPALTAVFFDGNQPENDYQAFSMSEQVRVYRRAGASGWSSTYADRPVFIWPEFAPAQKEDASIRMDVFTEPGQTLIVERSDDLASGVWTAVSTNVSANSMLELIEPFDGPSGFYRITVP